MFPIVVNDGKQKLPDDDICYIVAKEGVFLKKKIGVMESVAPVKNISILNSVASMARMHINPIPAQTGAKILEFFKEVYSEYRGEAIVLLFYNETTGKYRVVPPHQKVTASACDYNRGITVKGFTMIGTIHSHANFSAFHSGTDDDDEKTFDGLHITYGHVTSEECTISASIVANGFRFMVDPEDYMLGVKKTADDEVEDRYITKVYKYVAGKMVVDKEASTKSVHSRRKFDKRYIFTASESKRKFNPKWMNNVERGTYVYTYSGYGYGAGNYWSGRNRSKYTGAWGSRFDADAWKDAYGIYGQKQLTGSPPKTGTTKTGTKVPDVDPKNPCLSCVNRNIKIMDEYEGIEYEDEMYQCLKCGVIISSDDVDIKCPTCKTDKYLDIIDEKDLIDNHVAGTPPTIDDSDVKGKVAINQPDQQGFHTCEECNNTFLKLSIDENCPHCSTPLPDETSVMTWECPYCQGVFTEMQMPDENKCPHCLGIIDLGIDKTYADTSKCDKLICPKCKTACLITGLKERKKCFKCDNEFPFEMESEKETDEEVQMRTDSGSFLDQTDEEHQQILDAAAEADKNLERIPDPQIDKKSISIIDRMKRVFGAGGKDNDPTIH